MTPAEKRARKALDNRIDEIVRRRCSNLPINVLDISTVFRTGYVAAQAGADVEAAVVECYQRLSAKCSGAGAAAGAQ